MKKIFLACLFTVFILTGCDLGNTPTSKVEDLLSKYQMLDKSISTHYSQLTENEVIDEDLQKDYQKLIKKQYQNLSYEIKEEKIDGNHATVEAQIKVTDYQKAFSNYDKNADTSGTYYEQIAEDLSKEKEKIVYTINFELNKNDKGEWEVEPLDSDIKDKLLGIYSE